MATIASRQGYNPAVDGVMDILVTSPTGATYTALTGENGVVHGLKSQNINSNPWYWVPVNQPVGWNTAATDAGGIRLYPAGTYRVYVNYNVNHLQDNDQGVIGLQVPSPVQVSVSSGQVSLSGSATSVTQGNRFVTTITGSPDTGYYLWVKGTGSLSGLPGQQPPMLTSLPGRSGPGPAGWSVPNRVIPITPGVAGGRS